MSALDREARKPFRKVRRVTRASGRHCLKACLASSLSLLVPACAGDLVALAPSASQRAMTSVKAPRDVDRRAPGGRRGSSAADAAWHAQSGPTMEAAVRLIRLVPRQPPLLRGAHRSQVRHGRAKALISTTRWLVSAMQKHDSPSTNSGGPWPATNPVDKTWHY